MAYLKTLEVVNIGPFERKTLEFGPGLNVILGPNHCGKSSLLDSIKLFFQGGQDYDMIRHGQTHAEARINRSDGMSAFKTMDLATEPGKKDEYSVEVKGPSGELRKRYAEALEEWVPKGSFDPLSFLALKPADRAEFLIKRLKIVFSAEEVNQALLATTGKLPSTEVVLAPLQDGMVDLKKFNEIIDTIYESRRLVNVAIRDTNGAIADLRRTLPPSVNGTVDWSTIRDGLMDEITQLDKDLASKEASIKLEAEQARNTERESTHKAIEELAVRVRKYASWVEAFAANVVSHAACGKPALTDNHQISDIFDTYSDFINEVKEISGLRASLEAFLKEVDSSESAAIREQTAELADKRSRLSLELGTAKANADQHTAAAGTRAAIAKREEDSRGLTLKEMRRTSIIEALEKLKHNRLRECPLEGLDIRFEKTTPIITVNKTRIEKLSGQESLFLGLQCVQLASGDNPLVLTEGDSLTEEYVKILGDACAQAETPIQIIMARHSEDGGELRVVRYDQVLA